MMFALKTRSWKALQLPPVFLWDPSLCRKPGVMLCSPVQSLRRGTEVSCQQLASLANPLLRPLHLQLRQPAWKWHCAGPRMLFCLTHVSSQPAADLTVKFPGRNLLQASKESGLGTSTPPPGELCLEMTLLPLPSPQSTLWRLLSEWKAAGRPLFWQGNSFSQCRASSTYGYQYWHLYFINTLF